MTRHWLYFSIFLFPVLNKHISRAEDPRTPGDVSDDRHLLMIISLDGFARQYLEKYEVQLENLSRMYARGSSPKKFINQFVTKTYANHFSLGTGVYEEVHGVVGNNVLDTSTGKVIRITDEGFFTQNPGIYPVWTLNELNGGHSGCIMWPGCGVTYHGKNVSFWQEYQKGTDLMESLRLAFSWFYDVETPANLVFVYHEQPDVVGHAYGPDSPKVLEELLKIDEAMQFLFQKLTLSNLQDNLDVIILSDHGMSAVPEENIIDLDKIVDSSLYSISGGSPVLNIWPKNGEDLLVDKLLREGSRTHNYSVLIKHDIPEEWHYKGNARVSPILLIADEGYVFQDFQNTIDFYKNEHFPDLTTVHGDHGYFPNISSMEPIFLALGPSFKHKFKAPPFSNIDLYPLLCHMLSLPPGPRNGTLENISTILSLPVLSSLITPLLIALGTIVGLIGVIGVIACVLARKDSGRRVSADALINGYIHRKTMRSGSALSGEDAGEEEGLLESEVITVDM